MTVVDVRISAGAMSVEIQGLDLESELVTVFYGPNGAGKTTLLRWLAGVGGRRPVMDCAYQPQNPYLFRGSAGRNLGLGLDDEEAGRAGSLARSLGLTNSLAEDSSALSGGERHRLALARTLAKRATWVLLDEPLAGIDRVDRDKVLALLAQELKGRSAIVVTHDLDEAVALGDRVAVIDSGRLLQQGPLAEVLRRPATVEVAKILGLGNVVEGVGHEFGGFTTVTAGTVEVIGSGSVDGPARAIIPADSVVIGHVDQPESSARNRWVGRVTDIRRSSTVLEVTVDVGFPLVSMVTPGAADYLELEVGTEVTASVKATAVVVVPA